MSDADYSKQELSRKPQVLGYQCRFLEALLKRRVPLNLDDIASVKELFNEANDRKPWRGQVIAGLKRDGLIRIADWRHSKRRRGHATIRPLWILDCDDRTARSAIEIRKNLLQAIRDRKNKKPASGGNRKQAKSGRASA